MNQPSTESTPAPNAAKSRRLRRLETRLVPLLQACYRGCLYLRDQCSLPAEVDVESSKEYEAALAYWHNFEKKSEVNYVWVAQYAKDLAERSEQTDKVLDEKADSIIKYLGGGSTLLTFGALLSIRPEKPESCWLALAALVSLLPSLVFAVLAVRAALRVRTPQPALILPELTKAIHLAENYGTPEEAELNAVLILHPICEAYALRNARKAVCLKCAHTFYTRSLLLAFVPVFVICAALCFLSVRPQPQPPVRATAGVDSTSFADGPCRLAVPPVPA